MAIEGKTTIRVVLFFLIFLPISAGASTISVDLYFNEPILEEREDGLVQISSSECVSLGEPGHPLLPAREAVILLPPGENIFSLGSKVYNTHDLPGSHAVAYAPTPRPIGIPMPYQIVPPDEEIYSSNKTYPAEPVRLVVVQMAWGFTLAYLQVYPVDCQPLSGHVSWHEQITIEIETVPNEPGGDLRRIPNLRSTPAVRKQIANLVLNPENVSNYENCVAAQPSGSRLDPDYYPYVIVTTELLDAAFQELVHFQSSRGLRACTVSMSEILASYTGDDGAEKLRNFIIDAYTNWETEFVLLGGDVDLVPYRRLYANIQGFDDHFAGDCYFEGLDGTWNDDDDAFWGEWGEFDLVGEVAVGRATVETEDELSNWLHKNVMYTEHPVVGEIEKGLFLGEQLDEITWGGYYMDEIKDDAATHGYETSGYPESYLKECRYDRDQAYDGADVIALMNAGFPTTHHLGHSSWMGVMKIYIEDIPSLTNNGLDHSYMLNYSQGCHANQFEGYSDAISEHLLYNEHGSAAFVGNTSYGYFFPGVTSGPSQHYERQFVDACYGENITRLGWMNVDSKSDNVWMLTDWLLWCHYTICLIGDPAMPQWRELAGELELVHAGGYVIGLDEYDITVRSGGVPASNATVTLYSDDLQFWSSATTDLLGVATLQLDPTIPQTLFVKAVKADYLPANDSLSVVPAEGPWLMLDHVDLDDDSLPPSIGDGDGLADEGEVLELHIRLHNVGPASAENVTAILSCADPKIAVIDSVASYGSLGPGAQGFNLDDFVVQITNLIEDGEVVSFDLKMICDDRQFWNSGFGLELHAPILSLVDWEIEDMEYGDGEGDMDPGEVFAVSVTLSNSGGDEGRGIEAILTCESQYLLVEDAESGFPLIPAGGSSDIDPPFSAELAEETPTDLEIDFELLITTWAGQETLLQFTVPVASLFEEYFEIDSDWTAGLPGDDATTGVWVRVDPIGTWGSGIPIQPDDDHTIQGTDCFVTGQGEPGDPPLVCDVDGGKTTLQSPLIDLSGAVNPRLVYWRWWTNNYGPAPGEDIWQVDISNDAGDTWISLESAEDGINEWIMMEFYLQNHIEMTNEVLIRFIASDYSDDSLIEAAVDDIAIESSHTTAVDDNLSFNDTSIPAVRLLGSNPIRLGPDGALIHYSLPGGLANEEVRLGLYGIDGRLIRTLAHGRQTAGAYTLKWDGRSAAGVLVPSGIYFCHLKAGGQDSRCKLVLVR